MVVIRAFCAVLQFPKVDIATKDMSTTPAPMDEILRYTDLPTAIKLARELGMTNQQIVRLLTGSTPYDEARKAAIKAAPLLGITVAEFMRLRKNA